MWTVGLLLTSLLSTASPLSGAESDAREGLAVDAAPAANASENPPPTTTPPAPSQDLVGLSPLTMFPLQLAVGAGVGILASVVLPFAPLVVAFVVASLSDMAGQKRGAILWPMVGGYLGLVAGVLAAIGGWGSLFVVGAALAAAGVLLTGGMMTGLPVVLTAVGVGVLSIASGATLVVPFVAAAMGGVGNGCGAVVGYVLSAETKRPGDAEFRFPGFVEPSHAATASRERLPAPDVFAKGDGTGRAMPF